MTESASVECDGGEWLEDGLVGLLLPVDLDLELDLPNTRARDKDRLVREFDRFRAASDLNSEEGPPEVVELEHCCLGRSAERNFD
jgi:hypothetical protein